MAAHFEIKSGIVRWGPYFYKYGDPWTGSAFVNVQGKVVNIDAYTGDMMPRVVRDVGDAIKRVVPEAEEIVFTRIKDGVERKGRINMANNKRYRVIQPPVQLIECGEDGFEKVVWEGEGNSWDGNYETGVIVQRHFKKFIDAMQAEGEARLKKGM